MAKYVYWNMWRIRTSNTFQYLSFEKCTSSISTSFWSTRNLQIEISKQWRILLILICHSRIGFEYIQWYNRHGCCSIYLCAERIWINCKSTDSSSRKIRHANFNWTSIWISLRSDQVNEKHSFLWSYIFPIDSVVYIFRALGRYFPKILSLKMMITMILIHYFLSNGLLAWR